MENDIDAMVFDILQKWGVIEVQCIHCNALMFMGGGTEGTQIPEVEDNLD